MEDLRWAFTRKFGQRSKSVRDIWKVWGICGNTPYWRDVTIVPCNITVIGFSVVLFQHYNCRYVAVILQQFVVAIRPLLQYSINQSIHIASIYDASIHCHNIVALLGGIAQCLRRNLHHCGARCPWMSSQSGGEDERNGKEGESLAHNCAEWMLFVGERRDSPLSCTTATMIVHGFRPQ